MKPIITEMTLCNPEDGISTESALIIRIEDEGGGAFLAVEGSTAEEVRLNADEVPDFVEALKDMAAICKGLNHAQKNKETKPSTEKNNP